jgi:4'-phosphopantetheinyl transferase
MQIYLINLKGQFHEINNSLFMKLLDTSREKELNKLKFVEDRVRGLYADLLVRYVLIDVYGIPNRDIRFYKNRFGKPYITLKKNIHFNYSHSGDFVVCVFDDNRVGVDVEKIRNIDLDISNMVFTPDELQELSLKKEDEKLDCFYKFWTLKESYIKAVGIGLSKNMKSFSILSLEDETYTEYDRWYFKQYDAINGYKVSVCAAKSDFPNDIENVPLEKLKEFFLNYCVGSPK